MKIAFVVHDYNRSGGHSRYVAELASRFSAEHDVHVFANTFDGRNEPQVTFHKVPAWRATALTTVLTFALPAWLRVSRDFDVVHVQGFCGPRGNVITTHICNEAWYRALGRQRSIKWHDRLFHFFAGGLERRLYSRARGSQVIAISERVAHDVFELYDCKSPIQVIHHGVDLVNFSMAARDQYRAAMRHKLGLGENEMVFSFVGNLRKGAAECIRALSKLDSGRLVLVSPSDATSYRALASRLSCGDKIIFEGRTDRIETFYATADALLLPTPYDSFALVVTEAMACGLPVVVSREAGASELIRHQQNGLVLNGFSDVDELAGYMDALCKDRTWSWSLGLAAHNTVEAMSWDSVAAKTLQVYEAARNRTKSQLQRLQCESSS